MYTAPTQTAEALNQQAPELQVVGANHDAVPPIDLVAGGGAMRGFFSLGAMQEPWQRMQTGEMPAAETIYTASVGAVAALGYLHPEGPEVFSEVMLDLVPTRGYLFKRFIDRKRIWEIADIDYAVNQCFLPNFPVNDQTFARTEVIVSTMDAKTGDLSYERLTPENIEHLLCATMAAPILYNPVKYNGRKVVDAAIVEAAPLLEQVAQRQAAEQEAVTGLVLTRGLDEITDDPPLVEKMIRRIWPLPAKVRKAVRDPAPWRDVEMVALAHARKTKVGPLVTTAPGPEFVHFSRLETDPEKLGELLAEGRSKSELFANQLAAHLGQLAADSA